jgi:sialic acid synthase SpsE
MNSHTAGANVTVGDKTIGDGHPIYIMADVGLTNGGDLERAMRLIDIVADMGVDAVKFQMIGPETLLGDKSVEYTYPTLKDGPRTENMFEMFKGLSYSEEQWAAIASYARQRKLEFICTAHYMGAVPILERIGVNLHKICTWSVTHKRLVQEIGKTGKPLMLDTGASTASELSDIFTWHGAAGGRGVVILHDFHTAERQEMNFRAIPYMKSAYNAPVGYTPQGRDSDMDFMAIGLGVNVLEKRITIDRAIPQNGHIKALEPDEFKDWLQRTRDLETSLGLSSVLPTKTDLEQTRRYFKSLYTKVDVGAGELLSDDKLEARRPGTGISARYVDDICGRRAARDIRAETMLDWDDFQ